MYGSQLWDKTSSEIETMYTKWRKEHRKVLGLPSNRYYELLQFIEDNIPLEYINDCRYVSFFPNYCKF